MAEKIVAISPAYNEEKYVWQVVECLNECTAKGIISDYRIIENGSTDGTRAAAEQAGAKGKVISIPRKGKGRAVIVGAEWAKESDASILVTLDSDLEYFQPKDLSGLISPVLEKKTPMSVSAMVSRDFDGEVHYYSLDHHLSGQRAIRMTALAPLFAGNKRWRSLLGKNYHLETALTHLIKYVIVLKPRFVSRPLFHNEDPAIRKLMPRQIGATERYLKRRNAVASLKRPHFGKRR